MQKFMNITLLLCCGLLWNVSVSAQDAIVSNAKSDCKVSTACRKSASADASTTPEAIRVSEATTAKATSNGCCAAKTKTASSETDAQVPHSATMVALLNYLPATTASVSSNCKLADCKPTNCDPADCKPANCDPDDCPPACKSACTSAGGSASVAQTSHKLQ